MKKVKTYLHRLWHHPAKWQEAVIYAVCCLVAFHYVLALNERQALHGLDLPQHIRFALNESGYSLASVLLRYSYRLTDSATGCAVLLALATVATFFTIAYFFSVCANETERRYNRLQCFLISFPLCFIGSLYIPSFAPFHYLRSFLTQPLHNSTYTLMRLTGFLVVGLYIKIRNKYLNSGITLKEWLLFFVLLTVTNAIKPNFVMFFAPAMLCELLYDFVKTHGKKWKVITLFGVAVLCSLPVLVLQFTMLFPQEATGGQTTAAGEPSHVVFGLQHLKKIITPEGVRIHLLCSLLFVLAVTVLCIIKKHVSRNLIFGWLMFFFAYAERGLLTETGRRATHGNFVWGIYMASLLLTVICLERLLSLRKRIKWPLFVLLLLILVLMVVCGIAYFRVVLLTDSPLY